MKHLSLILLNLLITCFAYSQANHPNCNCPKTIYAGTKADTTFHLSNGKSIALCGYRDTAIEKGKVYFSEFVLSVCGDTKIIKFWEAVLVCRLRVAKDTLIVETMVNLPVGKNGRYKETVWTIERIHFVKGKAVLDFGVNRQIHKYNRQQIASSLREFEGAKKGNSDANMEIADKLLMSAISGSRKARAYLIGLKKKVGVLSGAIGEWYNNDRRMLKLWDTNILSYDDY